MTFTTDWHINLKAPQKSVMFPGQQKIPDEQQPLLQKLIKEIEARTAKGERRFNFELLKKMYRAEIMPNGNAALRVIPETIPTMEDLGFPTFIRNQLIHRDLSQLGGLVIIAGPGGAGKTTTMYAAIQARAQTLGGYFYTIENPIEYRLDGFVGEKGYVDQNSIREHEYPEALSHSMRCFPAGQRSTLVVGEILDALSAQELFKIMSNGHLVFCTMHALGATAAIDRLITMATSPGDDKRSLRHLLGESLRLVIHQEVVNDRRKFSPLVVTSTARSIIQGEGDLSGLRDEIANLKAMHNL